MTRSAQGYRENGQLGTEEPSAQDRHWQDSVKELPPPALRVTYIPASPQPQLWPSTSAFSTWLREVKLFGKRVETAPTGFQASNLEVAAHSHIKAAFGRVRQKDRHEFEDRQGYNMRLCFSISIFRSKWQSPSPLALHHLTTLLSSHPPSG